MARAIVGGLVGGTDAAGPARLMYEVIYLHAGAQWADRVQFETSEDARPQEDDRALVAAVRARFLARFGYELPHNAVSFHSFSKG